MNDSCLLNYNLIKFEYEYCIVVKVKVIWTKCENCKIAPSSGIKMPLWARIHRKDFFTSERAFFYELVQSFINVTQLLRVNMGVHLTPPKLKKIFLVCLDIAHITCHKT